MKPFTEDELAALAAFGKLPVDKVRFIVDLTAERIKQKTGIDALLEAKKKGEK